MPKHLAYCLLSLIPLSSFAQATLKPVFLELGDMVYSNQFEKSGAVDKKVWQSRQGTQWEIKDGMLVGNPSSPEYQKKKKEQGNGHLGVNPRATFLNPPHDYVSYFRIKFEGGERTTLTPLIESGHHFTRLYFASDSTQMLADHEEVTLAQLDKVMELDQWYEVIFEIKGDQFVAQVGKDLRLYGKHSIIADPERVGLGICGTKNGRVLIDDFYVWKAGKILPTWNSGK